MTLSAAVLSILSQPLVIWKCDRRVKLPLLRNMVWYNQHLLDRSTKWNMWRDRNVNSIDNNWLNNPFLNNNVKMNSYPQCCHNGFLITDKTTITKSIKQINIVKLKMEFIWEKRQYALNLSCSLLYKRCLCFPSEDLSFISCPYVGCLATVLGAVEVGNAAKRGGCIQHVSGCVSSDRLSHHT